MISIHDILNKLSQINHPLDDDSIRYLESIDYDSMLEITYQINKFIFKRNYNSNIITLINIIQKINKYDGLYSFKKYINNLIVNKYFNPISPDKRYLYSLASYAYDDLNPVINCFAKYVSEFLTSKMTIEAIEEVSIKINYNKCKIYDRVIDSYADDIKALRSVMLFQDMPNSSRYDLLIYYCKYFIHSKFYILEQFLIDLSFNEYVYRILDDNSLLARTIIESKHNISHLLRINGQLRKLIFAKSKSLPKTLDSIFLHAKDQYNYELLFDMAKVYNKRKILMVLSSMKANYYLNEFFKLYKDDEEIKLLVPFI